MAVSFFLDDDLVNSFTGETNQYAHQYLNTVGWSPHSQDRNYKDVRKMKCGHILEYHSRLE